MSKTLTSILDVITSPLTLIDRDLGNAVRQIGLMVIGNAVGGPIGAAIGASIGAGINALTTPLPKPQTTEAAYKSPRPERVSGYGRGALNWSWVLFITDSKGYAIDVGVFHDGRIDGVERYYLGDRQVTILPGGWVQEGADGQYGRSDTIQVGVRLGERVETAFSQVTARVPDQWDASHRGDGCATGFVISKAVKQENYAKIYPTGGPNNTPLKIAGRWQRVYDWRDPSQSLTDPTTWRWSENPVLALVHYRLIRRGKQPRLALTDAGYPAELAAILQTKWSRLFAPTLAYWTAAADDCDAPRALRGVQTITTAKASAGDGSVAVLSTNGLSAGMQVTISVTGDSSKTEVRTVSGVSTNIITLSSGLSHDHPQGSQVTWASSSGSPATEPRYRTGVVHRHTDSHKQVENALLACFDGWMAPRSDGALIVYSGRYYAPTVTIGADEVVSYSLTDGVDEEGARNALQVSYISENHDYATVQTDPWRDEDDILRRGKELSQQLDLAVPSHAQARALAKRVLAQINAPKHGNCTVNAAGRRVIGQRYIRLVLEDAGIVFLDETVEVTKVRRLLQTGGVYFEWRVVDPSIDEWNPATEEGYPAPVGNSIAPLPLDAPTITSAVADYSAVSDDGTGVRITLTVAGFADRSDVTWYARWRRVGGVSWAESQYTDIDPGASVVLQTGFVPTAASVEVEVAYGVGDGRISPYSAATTVNTATDATPPDAATAVTLVGWVDSLDLSTGSIARATSYRWRIYAADGTTLIRTINTPIPAVSYTATQAAADGVRRSYVVKVAGVNAAGAGTEASSAVLTLPAPTAVTGVTASGGATEAQVSFSLVTGAIGYEIAVSTASGFDPLTQGTIFYRNGSPAYLQGLAAGNFHAKVAAYDAWTQRPDLLNFSSEVTFTISTGGGGTAGGGGDGGGGWCVTTDTLILMADGTQRPAGDLRVGDMLRTQHETTLEWGDYPVEAIGFVEDVVYACDIGVRRMRATAGHLFWIGGWIRADAIGTPDGRAMVAKITVRDAHTYISNGVLSHNIKAEATIPTTP